MCFLQSWTYLSLWASTCLSKLKYVKLKYLGLQLHKIYAKSLEYIYCVYKHFKAILILIYINHLNNVAVTQNKGSYI